MLMSLLDCEKEYAEDQRMPRRSTSRQLMDPATADSEDTVFSTAKTTKRLTKHASSASISSMRSVLKYRRSHPRSSSSRGPWPTAEMFATILLCSSADEGFQEGASSDNSNSCLGARGGGSARFSLGMTLYKHIHSKITQDVCNAIFLCKV